MSDLYRCSCHKVLWTQKQRNMIYVRKLQNIEKGEDWQLTSGIPIILEGPLEVGHIGI